MTDWLLYSFVARSMIRQEVLTTLLRKPSTPSQVSKKLGRSLNATSRAVRELVGKGLVECVTDSLKKGRVYKITTKGESVLKEL